MHYRDMSVAQLTRLIGYYAGCLASSDPPAARDVIFRYLGAALLWRKRRRS